MRNFFLYFFLSITCLPLNLYGRQGHVDEQGFLSRTSHTLYGITALSLGSIIALISLKNLELATTNLGIGYARLRSSGNAYAQNLTHIDPTLHSLEKNFWAGAHILTKLPQELLPFLWNVSISSAAGYFAIKFLRSAYNALHDGLS